MSRMPLYARTFPYSAELVGFVQAVNGRHWVGIGMERKRYLACGCGRGRMGTGADYLLNDIPFQESSSRMIDFYSYFIICYTVKGLRLGQGILISKGSKPFHVKYA